MKYNAKFVTSALEGMFLKLCLISHPKFAPGWALIWDIVPKVGDGCSFEGRSSFVRLWYFHTHYYVCAQVSKLRDFTKQLCCNPEAKVKVVSIFGNTGDGKSHTLNYTFFQGMEVRPQMQFLGGGAVVIMLYVYCTVLDKLPFALLAQAR